MGGPSVLVVERRLDGGPDGTTRSPGPIRPWIRAGLGPVLLPGASFSADGEFLAPREGRDHDPRPSQRGADPQPDRRTWPAVNWSSTGARFVAGVRRVRHGLALRCDRSRTSGAADRAATERGQALRPCRRSEQAGDAERSAVARRSATVVEIRPLLRRPARTARPPSVDTIPAPAYVGRTYDVLHRRPTSIVGCRSVRELAREPHASDRRRTAGLNDRDASALRGDATRLGTIASGSADGTARMARHAMTHGSCTTIRPGLRDRCVVATYAGATIAWPAGSTRRYPVIWVGGPVGDGSRRGASGGFRDTVRLDGTRSPI